MKAYEVKLSSLVLGEIESPTEAVTRFCIKMGIPTEVRDKFVFCVKDAVTGETFDVDMTGD